MLINNPNSMTKSPSNQNYKKNDIFQNKNDSQNSIIPRELIKCLGNQKPEPSHFSIEL